MLLQDVSRRVDVNTFVLYKSEINVYNNTNLNCSSFNISYLKDYFEQFVSCYLQIFLLKNSIM